MKKILVCLLLVAAMLLPLKAAVPSLRRHADGDGCCGHCGAEITGIEGRSDKDQYQMPQVNDCCGGSSVEKTADMPRHGLMRMSEIRNAPEKCGCQIIPDDGAPVNDPVRNSFNISLRQYTILAAVDFHGLRTVAAQKVRPPPCYHCGVLRHESISTTVLLN